MKRAWDNLDPDKFGEKVRYDWEQVDDVFLPVIFRKNKRFLSVRMAELKLLTR